MPVRPSTAASPTALFCDNETNTERLFGAPAITAYPKDGINDHVVSGAATVNPDQRGTKACWWYQLTVPAGGRAEVRLRLHRPESVSTDEALVRAVLRGRDDRPGA